MHSAQLAKSVDALKAIKHSVVLADNLRQATLASGLCSVTPQCASVQTLMHTLPDQTHWKVIDHCSAITRIYSIFEYHVQTLLTDWLEFLQRNRSFNSFDEKFKRAYRTSFASLLLKLEHRRNRHISLSALVEDYYKAISGSSSYGLSSHALLNHNNNLRYEQLLTILRKCQITNGDTWLRNHPKIKTFFSSNERQSDTVGAELRSLVEYRNDAAHGTPDEVLGKDGLLEYAEFIECLLVALTDLIAWHTIELGTSTGSYKQIGRCTESFPKASAFVATVSKVRLTVGERLFFRGQNFFFSSVIRSLQMMGTSEVAVEVADETEVGVSCDALPAKGTKIFLPVISSLPTSSANDERKLDLGPQGSIRPEQEEELEIDLSEEQDGELHEELERDLQESLETET